MARPVSLLIDGSLLEDRPDDKAETITIVRTRISVWRLDIDLDLGRRQSCLP